MMDAEVVQLMSDKMSPKRSSTQLSCSVATLASSMSWQTVAQTVSQPFIPHINGLTAALNWKLRSKR